MHPQAGGSGTHAHTSLLYADDEVFLGEGVRFLARGMMSGERLVYVSSRPMERMRDDVAALGSGNGLLDNGTLTLVALEEGHHVVPEEQVAFVAAATERAVAEGHRGLRLLAELTGVAGDGSQRGNLLRYEHLADRYMSSHPVTAMCAVDATVLPEAVIADIQAVHRHGLGATLSGFRLLPEDDGFRLTGVVEAWDGDRLAELLRSITGDTTEVRLHLDELEFIGARGLAALSRYGHGLRSSGGRLTVVGARAVVSRAWTALGLDEHGPDDQGPDEPRTS